MDGLKARLLGIVVMAAVVAVALIGTMSLTAPERAQSVDPPDYWGPHCYVYRNTPQAIPHATNTVVVFSPAQVGRDDDGMFDEADPTVITCPLEAVYLVTSSVSFDWPGGNGHVSLYIDEYTSSRDTWERRVQERIPSPDAGQAMVSVACTIGVNAGDKVRMVVRQTSGHTLDIVADQYSRPKLAVVFLRPQYGYE